MNKMFSSAFLARRMLGTDAKTLKKTLVLLFVQVSIHSDAFHVINIAEDGPRRGHRTERGRRFDGDDGEGELWMKDFVHVIDSVGCG